MKLNGFRGFESCVIRLFIVKGTNISFSLLTYTHIKTNAPPRHLSRRNAATRYIKPHKRCKNPLDSYLSLGTV